MMEYNEYIEFKAQIQEEFDGRYVRISDCANKVKSEDEKIDKVMLEFTKSNTKLNILIGILSAIAIPILTICVNLLFSH